jgi:hypothetical protein
MMPSFNTLLAVLVSESVQNTPHIRKASVRNAATPNTT